MRIYLGCIGFMLLTFAHSAIGEARGANSGRNHLKNAQIDADQNLRIRLRDLPQGSKIKVFNIIGVQVASGIIETGTTANLTNTPEELVIPFQNFADGVYFVHDAEHSETLRVMKQSVPNIFK